MKIWIYIAFLFLPMLFSGQENHIDFSLTTDKSKVLIGNPVSIQLKFSYAAAIDESSIGFPVITDSTLLNEHIEIWDIQSPNKFSEENNLGDVIMTFEQHFTVACFDSGKYDIGPIPALIGSDTILSNIATLIVDPVLVDTTQDFKDIKQLSEDPLTAWEKFKIWFKKYWYWPTGILVAILAVWFWLRWKRNQPEEEEIIPEVPLSVRLLEKLTDIERQKLWQDGKLKQYYSEISEVLWAFIENKYQVATFEKTSREILSNLKMKAVSTEDLILLEKLFSLSDMVKFAKSLPTGEENEEALNIARNFILANRNDINKTES